MPKLKHAMFALIVASSPVATAPAFADLAPVAGAETCGKALGPEIVATWMQLDGRDGRLGCPVESEGDTATSTKGTAARIAHFEGGEVIRHMSGPLAGQAFAVYACDRLYVQYGGESGWLGLPTSDAINTPDGQRQRFEGGVLTLTRAFGTCEAEQG